MTKLGVGGEDTGDKGTERMQIGRMISKEGSRGAGVVGGGVEKGYNFDLKLSIYKTPGGRCPREGWNVV